MERTLTLAAIGVALAVAVVALVMVMHIQSGSADLKVASLQVSGDTQSGRMISQGPIYVGAMGSWNAASSLISQYGLTTGTVLGGAGVGGAPSNTPGQYAVIPIQAYTAMGALNNGQAPPCTAAQIQSGACQAAFMNIMGGTTTTSSGGPGQVWISTMAT